jgi:hypothetical protein
VFKLLTILAAAIPIILFLRTIFERSKAVAEGNAGQHCTHRAQYRISVSQALERIRQAIAVVTRGGNRMRESCKYGSVRGAPSNGRPYRDRREFSVFLGGAAGHKGSSKKS